MTARNRLVIAGVCALAAWMPVANAQLHGRQETRSGVLEFEANGYPTDQTVERVREEIDYQRAVQAYIHFVPAVAIMQWRNAHLGPLGGKPGDLIVYRTTEQKLPIITANDTTTYVITFADLSDTVSAAREVLRAVKSQGNGHIDSSAIVTVLEAMANLSSLTPQTKA